MTVMGKMGKQEALASSQLCSEPLSMSSMRFSTMASVGKRVVTRPRRTVLLRTASSSTTRCMMPTRGDTSMPFLWV